MSEFKTIQLKDIHPDPNQPRKFYDELSMSELTQSVKEKGVLQPILIRPNGKGYILVCGERRFRASKDAGLQDIPAVIRELSDEEALELQIIENLQRKDVHPMEEAVAFKSLIQRKQWTTHEVGQRVGKSDTYIRQRLKLADLSAEWQKMFYKNAFTLSEALQLCMLPEKQQKEFYKNEVDKDDEKADHPKISINSYRLDQYKGDLHKAAFDLSDTTLDKKAGPCTTCQFNTGVLKLFGDHGSLRCTNVSCFKHKTDIHFDRELKKACEDPEVILVHDVYTETDLLKKLKKQGHQILKEYTDYSEIIAPEKPDWEEFKDDYDDDAPEKIVLAAFEKELKEYEKDQQEYQKKISTGRYKKAFIVEDNWDRGKYVYIELKKKAAQSSGKAAVESGNADISDIDNEISRIRDREKRNKELDGEKVYTKVREIFSKSTEILNPKRDCNLTDHEITAAAVALWKTGDMDYKKWFKKHLELSVSNYYSLKASEIEKIQLTYFGLNELILHFIKSTLLGNGGSHLEHGDAAAIYKITKYYHEGEVNTAELEQQELITKRTDRVAKRISDLQAKKKELQAASKPSTKKSKSK